MTAGPFQQVSAAVCDITLREGLQSGLSLFTGPGAAARYVESVIRLGWAVEAEIYRPGRHISEREFAEVHEQNGWDALRLYCGSLHRLELDAIDSLPAGVQRLSFTVVRGTEAEALVVLGSLRARRPTVSVRLGFECTHADGIKRLLAADELFVERDSVAICDSAGNLTPADIPALVATVQSERPAMPIEGHFHNDRGLAMTNWLILRDLGGRSCDASLAGLGERSGVLPLEVVLGELLPRDQFDDAFAGFHKLRAFAGEQQVAQHVPLPFNFDRGFIADSHRDAGGSLRPEYAQAYFSTAEAK